MRALICLALLACDAEMEDPVAATTRIMSVGDSISAQSEPANFQIRLYNMLVARGFQVDFVGSQNGVPPLWVEAYPGAKLTDLDVPAYLVANPAEVVILHAGINDVSGAGGFTAQQAADHLRVLLSDTFAARPRVFVIVAQIMPAKNGGGFADNAIVDDFNEYVPHVVTEFAVAGRRASYVDCNTGYDRDNWFSDTVHQDGRGSEFLALRFLEGLREVPVITGAWSSAPPVLRASYRTPPPRKRHR